MTALAQALVAVAVVSTAIVVAAPADKSLRKASATSASTGSRSFDGSKKLRRGKRQVMIEPVIDEDDGIEEAAIRDQLRGLTDSQLAMLADLVQNEINRYSDLDGIIPEYEVIELPDEILEQFPRDRRAAPLIIDDLDDGELVEEPDQELFVVPEEVLEDALQEQEDDMELRMRIAEMANILNERAARRRL